MLGAKLNVSSRFKAYVAGGKVVSVAGSPTRELRKLIFDEIFASEPRLIVQHITDICLADGEGVDMDCADRATAQFRGSSYTGTERYDTYRVQIPITSTYDIYYFRMYSGGTLYFQSAPAGGSLPVESGDTLTLDITTRISATHSIRTEGALPPVEPSNYHIFDGIAVAIWSARNIYQLITITDIRWWGYEDAVLIVPAQRYYDPSTLSGTIWHDEVNFEREDDLESFNTGAQYFTGFDYILPEPVRVTPDDRAKFKLNVRI